LQLYYKDEYIRLFQGDCLEVMDRLIEKGLKVDMILCDLPYKITRNKWDIEIDLIKLWDQYNRIIKYNGAIVLTANEPFTSELIMSNIDMYKYKIIWEKTVASSQMNCNYAPLRIYEEILIFSKAAACYVKDKSKAMTYNPQFSKGEPYKIKRKINTSNTYDYQKENEKINDGYRYPNDIIKISNPRIKNGHPTQKPVGLMEYLINTYTNEGELVLDNTCGSGTTLLAARNLKRKCIGIELEEKYCEIAKNRLTA
jgi:site-specific DNA-methyltransferase (adenine-specific)